MVPFRSNIHVTHLHPQLNNDRLLKGEKPGDFPFQAPVKFDVAKRQTFADALQVSNDDISVSFRVLLGTPKYPFSSWD